MNDLRERRKLGDDIITTASPTAKSDRFVWPDSFVQEHPLGDGNPIRIEHAGYTALVYRRGTPELEEVQEKFRQIDEVLRRRRAEAEAQAEADIAAIMAEVEKKASTAAVEPPPDDKPVDKNGQPLKGATLRNWQRARDKRTAGAA